MDINNHNYEEFAIDYLEGNLSPKLQEAMQLFLLQNPDIEAEWMGLEEMVLEADEAVVFPDKAVLLQSEDAPKVVPLFRKWKRFVLPMAAALCLFFVWQKLLQPVGEGDTVVDRNVLVQVGDDCNGFEDSKNGVEEVLVKVKPSESIAVYQPSTAKMKESAAQGIQDASIIEGKVGKVLNVNSIKYKGFEVENRREVTAFRKPLENAAMEGLVAKESQKKAKVIEKQIFAQGKKPIEVKEKEERSVLALAALPIQSGEVRGEVIAATDLNFRKLPQNEVLAIENNKTKSTFLNNLKRAITPEVLASDEMYESGTDSEILVSISMKPEQHDFIKKIFKNNR